eukprot:COSAG02_NODE_168_length_31711_cov_68.337973_8_plen_179_part_00
MRAPQSAWGHEGTAERPGVRVALRQLRQGAEFGLGLVVLLPTRLAILIALVVTVTALSGLVLCLDQMTCGCRCAPPLRQLSLAGLHLTSVLLGAAGAYCSHACVRRAKVALHNSAAVPQAPTDCSDLCRRGCSSGSASRCCAPRFSRVGSTGCRIAPSRGTATMHVLVSWLTRLARSS